MEYQTFKEILQDEGITNNDTILVLWQDREDKNISEDRLRQTCRIVKKKFHEFFEEANHV